MHADPLSAYPSSQAAQIAALFVVHASPVAATPSLHVHVFATYHKHIYHIVKAYKVIKMVEWSKYRRAWNKGVTNNSSKDYFPMGFMLS